MRTILHAVGIGAVTSAIAFVACVRLAHRGLAVSDQRVRPADPPESAVAIACQRLWLRASADTTWDDIAVVAIRACAEQARVDELVAIIAHHPAARREPYWRGAVEQALAKRASQFSTPAGVSGAEPVCRLLRDAEGLPAELPARTGLPALVDGISAIAVPRL